MAQPTYGAPWRPLADVYGEQWVFEPLTSDPTGTEQGDHWLRVDLDSGDKLATLRFDHGSGIWDIPVFPVGTSENGVEEVRQVETPNGRGFIPVLDSGAAFPQVGFQHAGTRYGLHDSVDAIPDSEIDHWDAQAAFSSGDDGTTISSWPGENGDYTVTGSDPTIRENAINGNRAVEFDGVGDSLSTAFASAETQPNTVFAVIEYLPTDTGTYGFMFDGDSTRHSIEQGIGLDPGSTTINAGSNVTGPSGSTNNDPTIITGIYDGGNSLLRQNGSQIASGAVGSNSLDGVQFGEASGGSNYWDGYIGEVIPYPERLSSGQIDAQEQELADKWGITL